MFHSQFCNAGMVFMYRAIKKYVCVIMYKEFYHGIRVSNQEVLECSMFFTIKNPGIMMYDKSYST